MQTPLSRASIQTAIDSQVFDRGIVIAYRSNALNPPNQEPATMFTITFGKEGVNELVNPVLLGFLFTTSDIS